MFRLELVELYILITVMEGLVKFDLKGAKKP